MARLNAREDPDSSSLRPSSTSRATRLQSTVTPPSPSPSASSDKENDYRPNRSDNSMDHGAKRRRVEENSGPSGRQHAVPRADDNPDLQYYDPNQDVEERRQVRKGLRELNQEAVDMRQEWLAPQSTGLRDLAMRADVLFNSVKQTSDAIIDSRLLVTAGDLAYKKTQHITLGDGGQGVDVDEFVSKCIAFMNRAVGDNTEEMRPSNTQRRRRRATQANDSSDEEQGPDAGDALNWEWLGAQACFPSNSRPPVPGFLLGPLSVQKRARTQRARRERLQRQGPGETTRPDELKAADLEQSEKTNTKAVCETIYERYMAHLRYVEENMSLETPDNVTQDEMRSLCHKYHITEDGGIPLFRFALHPTSFGQTVENLFYVSFLIKDGYFGINHDEDGMPALYNTRNDDRTEPEPEPEQRQDQARGMRHQAVLSLDFETWEELVKLFKIDECIISDRSHDRASIQIGATGWYG